MTRKAAAKLKPTQATPATVGEQSNDFPRTISHKDIQLFDTIQDGNLGGLGGNAQTVTAISSAGDVTVVSTCSSGSIRPQTRPHAQCSEVVQLVRRPSEEERKAVLTEDNLNSLIRNGYNTISMVGSDPEIFVENEEGKVVPAFTFLKNKEEVEVEDPYWDGFQAEFSTQPSHCIAYLADSTHQALKNLHEQVTIAGKGKWKLSDKSVVDVDQDFLNSIDPRFSQFGCTPSMNAYNDYPPMVDGTVVPFRMAGGHIHIGARLAGVDVNHMVKQMDKIVGVLSVALFRDMEDPRRRFLYGRAGEYRLPPHGLEYRVMSNAWLCHPAVMHFITHAARISAAVGMWGFSPTDITDEEAKAAINNSDSDLAVVLIERNKDLFDRIVNAIAFNPVARGMFQQAINKGIKLFLPDKSIEKVWLTDSNNWWAHSASANTSISGSVSTILATGKLG